jgi:hypothetical protein
MPSVTGNSSVAERQQRMSYGLILMSAFLFFFLLLNSGCSISNMCAIFCRSALEEFPLSLQDAQSHIVPVCLPPGEKPAKGLHGRIIKVCGLMKMP